MSEAESIKDSHDHSTQILQKYRAILDLSYMIQTKDQTIKLVNEKATETAPKGAMAQMGNVLNCVIHVCTEVDDDKVIFSSERGHQGQVLEVHCGGRGGVKFYVHLTTSRGRSNKSRGANITPDGMDQISRLFLYIIRGRKRCGQRICTGSNWILTESQIPNPHEE